MFDRTLKALTELVTANAEAKAALRDLPATAVRVIQTDLQYLLVEPRAS